MSVICSGGGDGGVACGGRSSQGGAVSFVRKLQEAEREIAQLKEKLSLSEQRNRNILRWAETVHNWLEAQFEGEYQLQPPLPSESDDTTVPTPTNSQQSQQSSIFSQPTPIITNIYSTANGHTHQSSRRDSTFSNVILPNTNRTRRDEQLSRDTAPSPTRSMSPPLPSPAPTVRRGPRDGKFWQDNDTTKRCGSTSPTRKSPRALTSHPEDAADAPTPRKFNSNLPTRNTGPGPLPSSLFYTTKTKLIPTTGAAVQPHQQSNSEKKRKHSESSTCTTLFKKEKKSQPQPRPHGSQSSQELEADEDAPCGVCGDEHQEVNNSILFCDRCNLAVHQACYGIQAIPEGKWYCNPCEQRLDTKNLECRLCSIVGGALKPVSSPSKTTWAHVWCTWWVPETVMGSVKAQQPVKNLDKIPKARWKLTCSICKVKKGAPIQCRHGNCTVAFHPSCAQQKGLKMLMNDPGPESELSFVAFCNKHRNCS